MAKFRSFSTDSESSFSSELYNRPDKTFVVKGQAEFLAVAVALDVPILSVSNNVVTSMNTLAAGEGASFAVFSSTTSFTFDKRNDIINPTAGVKKWLQEAKSSQRFHRYVTKRIVTSERGTNDSQHLAALVNELRILSCEALRNCESIVSMLGISWCESSSSGRFWPQVILEAAPQGNLAEYLPSTDVSFSSKLAISGSIGLGLEFLHAHGIIHADLKPTNILIFNRNEDRTVSAGLEPIQPKICDFGYAIILDDYNSKTRFKARVGTPTWMAPEIDAETPIELDNLHKADIYSFGLLLASILMDGRKPFGDLEPNEVSIIKAMKPEDETSAVATMLRNIKATTTMINNLQEEYIAALLRKACSPSPLERVSLSAIQRFIQLGRNQDLARGKPLFPLRWFQEFAYSDCEYTDALNALDGRTRVVDGSLRSAIPTALKDATSKEMGCPRLQQFLEGILNHETPEPASLRKFTTTWTSEESEDATACYRRRMEEAIASAISKVPDFAFETSLVATLFPRVARKEVFCDLKDTCDSESVADPLAYFHLAGAYFNGQVIDYSVELGLKYLAKAALKQNPESLCVILKVFEACNASLPKENEAELLAMVEEYGAKHFLVNRTEVFHNQQQNRHDPHYLLSKTWASKWPGRYLEYVHSSQDLYNVPCLIAGSAFYQTTRRDIPDFQGFNFSQIRTFNLFGMERLELSRKQDFKEEITRLDCANSCDPRGGFTLLQLAAVKGDIVLAETLVMELDVFIDSYGDTPRWTPLLLSCRCGNFAVAKWLIEHGANPAVREDIHGATILHSLHQFTERQHCEEVLNMALSAGLDINPSHEGGTSPLHSLFFGWDYSRGVAAELLLTRGGDPTRPVTNEQDGVYGFTTPLGYAAQALDIPLLRRMLSSSERIVSVSGRQAEQRLNKAKAQAIIALFSRTRFHYMSVGGKGYENKVEEVLSLLVNSDVAKVHSTFINQYQDPSWPVDLFLSMSVARGSGFFTEKYLNAFPETIVEYPSRSLHMNLLQNAIERRSRESIHAILRHGGDLLTKNETGRNSLHFAAHHFPEILIDLIKVLEDSPEKRRGMSVTEILEQQDHAGHTVFGQLLAEGYEDERHIAESLRVKYNLRHDYRVATNDMWITFGGFMVMAAAAEGLIPIEHIEYLLSLDPPLEWNASSNGKCLLSLVVMGLSGSHDSFQHPRHQITGMLLEKYPVYELQILTDNAGRTVFHDAAFWSNITALQMIKDQLQALSPDRPIPWNVQAQDDTVLDEAVARLMIKDGKAILGHSADLGRVAAGSRRIALTACYRFLRENGALHQWELDGILLMEKLILFNVTLPETLSFVLLATRHLDLGAPVVDLEPSVDIGATSKYGVPIVRKVVLDLVWRQDTFFIKLYCVKVSSALTEAVEQCETRLRERQTEQEPVRLAMLGLPPGIYPWATLTYEFPLPEEKEGITWRRSGLTWTDIEVQNLKEAFSDLFHDFFKVNENEFFARIERGNSQL